MEADKKIPLKQRFYLWLGSHVAGRIIRLLRRTVKLEIVGQENLDYLMNNGGRAIFAFWHGNMVIPMMRLIGKDITALVSQHGDGEIIARILDNLGFGLVRGSSTRGGIAALKEMVKLLKQPNIVVITPDGPKGPYREFKIGAVLLAQRTGVPVLPMSAYTSSPRFLKSWDRFLIVKPFVHCVLMYGDPIPVEKDLTLEELEEKRRLVEQAVRDLDQKAETFFTTTDNQ